MNRISSTGDSGLSRFLLLLTRSLLLLAAAFAGVLTALLLNDLVMGNPNTWKVLGVELKIPLITTVSMPVVIALAKEVSLLVANLTSHLSRTFSSHLVDSVKMFFAVGASLLAVLTPADSTFGSPVPVPVPVPAPVQHDLVAYPVVMPSNDSAVLAILPLFHDNALRDAGNQWRAGVAIDGENAQILSHFVAHLVKQCSDGSATDKFALSTVGYASSSEFQDDPAGSNELNLQVSNERARQASEILSSLKPTDVAFDVQAKTHENFERMMVERSYLDRLGGEVSAGANTTAAHEHLNRRVEIWIHQAGSCTRNDLLAQLTGLGKTAALQ